MKVLSKGDWKNLNYLSVSFDKNDCYSFDDFFANNNNWKELDKISLKNYFKNVDAILIFSLVATNWKKTTEIRYRIFNGLP